MEAISSVALLNVKGIPDLVTEGTKRSGEPVTLAPICSIPQKHGVAFSQKTPFFFCGRR